ncbi:hypothetical protein HU761_11680 [Pseudomonas sp. SWRI59]|uniref:hypothetical protein n=1 Tax=unclassified Pseudomonas TaxID=196821 RepID=UPI0016466A35|nr:MULTISPECIES: hypothetical protein [unclassified Pseudomonas]MBC3502076.1 hypothetical protein [Pseudomonas sp. SWRI59]MBC3507084.1 hypothetical protein [Pseudomonas sp. SWRI68]
MRNLSRLIAALLLGISTPPLLAADATRVLNARGETALHQLNTWYNSTTDDCGGPDKPGYLCSGIALRTTSSSIGFLPWEPSDSQLEKGSVAFSWVRRDSNFGKPFGNQNGLTLYPPQYAPPGSLAHLNVLCTFPINANTNQRSTLQGCGPIRGFEETTDTCQALAVNTAQQWLARYPQAENYRVCGWNLRQTEAASAGAFNTALQARQGLNDAQWAVNNEVLLPVWKQGEGGALPVHSFFYVEGEREALAKAQYDQLRYQQLYEQLVPVINVRFPTDRSGIMSFGYAEGDQAVGRPTPTPHIDFEDVQPGSCARLVTHGVEFQLDRRTRGVSDGPHEGSKGLIKGHHLEADSTIKLVLEGAGRRLVTFAWGCNSYCGVQTAIGGDYEDLSDEGPGAMRYGTKEMIIDGPEVLTVVVDTEEDDAMLVFDHLTVRQLPHK